MRVDARHLRTPARRPWFALAAAATGLTLALLPACGDEEGEDSSAATPAATAAPSAEQVAAATETSKDEEALVYTYNAVGKRDPFRTYFSEIENEDAVNRKLTELQQYDLDQLRLVAVIVGTATPKAMVEDPTGKGHVVKTGTLIGKHWGQIKHIRRGEIIIQEEFRDFTGRRVTHLVPMKLPEEEKVKLE